MIKCLTMAQAEFELGVYANPFASESVKKRVRGILRFSPKGPTFRLTSPTYQYQPIPKRVVVAGGEGSIRTVVQMMYDREVVKPVGLLPGGSQNVLYNALRKLGLQSDAKTFLEKTLDDYPEDQRLRPGVVNNLVFVNHAGFGHFEQHLGELNKRLRFLRNGHRPLVCALLSMAAAILYPDGNRELLNLYTITPRIGQVLAFPDQELLNNNVTHAWVEGIRGFVRTLSYWQRGKPAPNGAMRQFQSFGFADNAIGSSIWLDGDKIPYDLQGALIKRAPYGIPVVAIT